MLGKIIRRRRRRKLRGDEMYHRYKDTWTNQEGHTESVSLMTDSHVMNVFRYLHKQDLPGDAYTRFLVELVVRGLEVGFRPLMNGTTMEEAYELASTYVNENTPAYIRLQNYVKQEPVTRDRVTSGYSFRNTHTRKWLGTDQGWGPEEDNFGPSFPNDNVAFKDRLVFETVGEAHAHFFKVRLIHELKNWDLLWVELEEKIHIHKVVSDEH